MTTPPFTHLCDRCGCPIEEQELRYIVAIQVYAAPTPIRITAEDLQDPESAIEKSLQHCEDKSPEDHMDDVHKEFRKDLCRRCQQQYIREPIPPVDP